METKFIKGTMLQVLTFVLLFPAYLQAITDTSTPIPPKQQTTELPQLVIYEEPLQFTLPPSCDNSVKFSFILFSKGAEIASLTVVPREAKTPDGTLLSSDAIKVAKANNTVTPAGIKITLTLMSSKFIQPGAYKVTLLFEGKPAGVQPLTKILTINQPVAAINQDDLKDRTFKLVKSFPWQATSGSYPLILYGPYNKTAIRDLIGVGLGVFRDKSKIQAMGKVSVTPESTECLALNDKLLLQLALSEFKQTGVFTSSIMLNSPSFDKPISIPLTVEVADKWCWPFFVIFIGVTLGFGISYLNKSYKPRQQNLLRLTKLRPIILKQIICCGQDPANQGKLYDLRRRLDEADEKNLAGDFAGAKASLDQVERDLYDFLKTIFEERVETRRSVEALISVIRQYHNTLPQPDMRELDALEILPKLLEAERHLASEEVAQAKQLLEDCQKKFDGFRKNILNREVQAKEDEIQKLTDAADIARLMPCVQNIRNSINANKFEEASNALDTLHKEIDQVKTIGKTTLSLPYNGLRIYKQLEFETISVINGLDSRTSGSIISFSLKGTLPDHDWVNWDFGDGAGTIQGQDAMSHSFDTSGVYTLEVRLMKGETLVKQFSRPVEILPGQSEISIKKIKRELSASDIATSLTALLLACLTGLIYLYMGKPFGSLEDYLLALLWGFGIDNGVRGFTAVYGKITQ